MCPDEDLRREVASLLAAGDRAGSFLEPQGREPTRPEDHRLPTGARLGPYEIEALLGAGGMGEVYRARDNRLGRVVAVKVLTSTVPLDAGRLERFEREARAAAALSHPNVLAVFDVGTHEGTPYLVTELLEGESLRSALSRGALSVAGAVDVAAQVARGLASAHEKGVLHRDLKPENLFVTRDGTVKILDFGLAKLIDRDTPAASAALTRTGTVMGTAGYMAPEQVRGLSTDARADIFALGAILYELLAGRRAFAGASHPDVLVAVLNDDPPPLDSLRSGLPRSLIRLVERCLRKEPSERFQTARDLAFALETLDENAAIPRESTAGRAPTWVTTLSAARRRVVATGALLVLGAAIAVAGMLMRPDQEDQSPSQPSFRQLTFRRGTVLTARFAPDGHTVVYGAAWEGSPAEVFSGRVESSESRAMGLPPGDVFAISSTGELALAIGRTPAALGASSATLARVALAGGGPRELMARVDAADWTPEGELALVREADGLSRLELPAGRELFSTAGWISHPRVSPDGVRVAFIHHPMSSNDGGSVELVDRAGERTTLAADWYSAQGLAWAPNGLEVWFTASRSGGVRALYAVTLEGDERLIEVAPATLTLHDIARDGRVLIARESLRLGILYENPHDVSVGGGDGRDLSWFDWSLVRDLSEDGRVLLFDESGEGAAPGAAVYLRATDGSEAVRLDAGAGMALSPDRQWVLSIPLEGSPRIVMMPAAAGSPRELRHPDVEAYHWADWLPDGKSIFFAANRSGEGVRGFVRRLDQEEARVVTDPGIVVFWKPVSPDGRRLALAGPDGVVQLFSIDGSPPQKLPGLTSADRPVRWSADGKALFVRSGSGLPIRIDRYDVTTGRRQSWREIALADRVGVVDVPRIVMTGDGGAYAFSYTRLLSELYLATGLQ